MMRERRLNIRPVRGITADTVRALIGLRHAGKDCAYLPLDRYQLADQVKGSLPAPYIDPADVPACMRPDCDSSPEKPIVTAPKMEIIGNKFARPPHANGSETQDETGALLGMGKGESARQLEHLPQTALPTNQINGRQGFVIIDEAPSFPSVAELAPLGCDDGARSADILPPPTTPTPAPIDRACAKRADGPSKEDEIYAAVVAKELRVRRENNRVEQAGADQGGRSAGAPVGDRPARRVHGSARPRARAVCPHEEQAAAGHVPKPQRLDLIRDIAARLEARKTPAPRPIVGQRIERKAVLPMAGDPIAQRREAIEQAIRFLKARCILVTITDRTALIRKCRVSGKRDTMLAEQVIEHAVSLGMGEQG